MRLGMVPDTFSHPFLTHPAWKRHDGVRLMSNERPKRESMSLEEATVSNRCMIRCNHRELTPLIR
jgi:hypothetical protein